MATEKDYALLNFLIDHTREGKLAWEPTAQPDQYVVSIKGKYNVIVDRSTARGEAKYWMKLVDYSDRELLRMTDDDADVKVLFDVVQRTSLRVDAAIDEIIGGSPR